MGKEEGNRLFYRCGKVALAACLLGLAALAIFGTGWLKTRPVCSFYRVTGLYCPGCGGTRAFLALLSGQLGKSLRYHPAVAYGAAVFFWFMISQWLRLHVSARIYVPNFLSCVFGGIGLLLAQWIAKNLLLFGFNWRL